MDEPDRGHSHRPVRTVLVTSSDSGSGSEGPSLITVHDSDSGTGTDSWLEIVLDFYGTHPRWLAAQLVLVAAGVPIGLGVGGVAGAIATAGLGLAGIFLIPNWRTQVRERRINSG